MDSSLLVWTLRIKETEASARKQPSRGDVFPRFFPSLAFSLFSSYRDGACCTTQVLLISRQQEREAQVKKRKALEDSLQQRQAEQVSALASRSEPGGLRSAARVCCVLLLG